MVGYMSLEEQVDADFARARRRALVRRLGARLRNDRGPGRLLCFEEIRRGLGAASGIYLGRRVVRSTDVVGSVGRCSEFDRAFLPIKASTGARWRPIDRAFHRAGVFPPVSLYKVGDVYFVLDGHHRVSVARFHGVEWLDAEVTVFRAFLPRDRRGGDEPMESSEGGERKSYKTMDLRIWKQRPEEMMREAKRNRLAKALRARERRAGRRSASTWGISRHAGRLLRPLRVLGKTG